VKYAEAMAAMEDALGLVHDYEEKEQVSNAQQQGGGASSLDWTVILILF
jgi:hypothetical protein